jgi:hypothetical protein
MVKLAMEAYLFEREESCPHFGHAKDAPCRREESADIGTRRVSRTVGLAKPVTEITEMRFLS